MTRQESHVELFARDLRSAFWVWVFVVVLGTLLGSTSFGRDETDPPAGGRSDMGLYTDHGTGCQYLGRFWGTLTPRLNGAGKQMGCRP